jgi:hypothetical protein
VLLACVATLGVWAVNPYMGLLVAIGLQAWLLAATRPGGRPTVVGLVLLGLVPLVLLVANLASRFDAGIGVWHDLLLMLADGQIGTSLALLGCVLGGAGVAIIALGGAPTSASSELEVDGKEISVRRQVPSREAELDPPEEEMPDEGEGDDPEAPPEPAQPEPERDPRLWSKPRGWISPPPGSRRATPWPSTT